MKNLLEALAALGACDTWHDAAARLSARQVFERAWQETNDPTIRRPALSWLAERTDSVDFLCYCDDDARAALLGLPFGAWADAVESYLAKAQP